MEWTNSRINKLGEQLRREDPPGEQAFAQLQEFRLRYDEPMRQVESILRNELHVEATSRLKTSNTIIEKLRREKTRLHTMQDIAGLRIVRDMTLTEQDALVNLLCAKLPESKIVDRRLKPSFGYRAVHVIVTLDGLPVEIQVRTLLQHYWAQSVEKLADELGRGLRYGEKPAMSVHQGRLLAFSAISQSIARRESRGLRAGRFGLLSAVIKSMPALVRAFREESRR
jgi:hypothetical protein